MLSAQYISEQEWSIYSRMVKEYKIYRYYSYECENDGIFGCGPLLLVSKECHSNEWNGVNISVLFNEDG